jgi:hypothetical protein
MASCKATIPHRNSHGIITAYSLWFEDSNAVSVLRRVTGPVHCTAIWEKPLQTLTQTRNWVGEGWSAQLAYDGQY